MSEQAITDNQVSTLSELIRASGGSIVGRTRLQKMVYLLEVAGFVSGFDFEYRHYGPYSEDLSNATFCGRLQGLISEEERPASWGGSYSIFSSIGERPQLGNSMQQFIDITVSANPIALELAATALFVAINEKGQEVWARTAQLKPEKLQHLEDARAIYSKLLAVSPSTLPNL
jgi:uncharacterized protein YwgA